MEGRLSVGRLAILLILASLVGALADHLSRCLELTSGQLVIVVDGQALRPELSARWLQFAGLDLLGGIAGVLVASLPMLAWLAFFRWWLAKEPFLAALAAVTLGFLVVGVLGKLLWVGISGGTALAFLVLVVGFPWIARIQPRVWGPASRGPYPDCPPTKATS